MEYELIEAVKKHPELYDTKHVNYMRAKLKNKIWCGIANTLKFKEGEEAKYIWHKLRANYRDARRRDKKCLKDGLVPEDIKPWRHQMQMSFLEPFMSTRSQEKNGNDESETNDDSQFPPEESKSEQPNTNMNELEMLDLETDYNEEKESRTTKTVLDNDTITDNNQISLNVCEDASNRARWNVEMVLPSITNSDVLMHAKKKTKFNNDILSMINHSIEVREKRVKEREEKRRKLLEERKKMGDPLYNFFMSMYQITKCMPVQYQHTIRSKVFQTVSNAETSFLNYSVNEQTKETSYSHISGSPSNQERLLELDQGYQIKQEMPNEAFISSEQNSTVL